MNLVQNSNPLINTIKFASVTFVNYKKWLFGGRATKNGVIIDLNLIRNFNSVINF